MLEKKNKTKEGFSIKESLPQDIIEKLYNISGKSKKPKKTK